MSEPNKDPDWAALTRRLHRNDEHAFKEIYDHMFSSIRAYISFRVNDSEVARDLTQETFIKMWESRSRLDEQRSLKAYLYTIAGRCSIGYLRRNRVRMSYLRTLEKNVVDRSPEQILESKELIERIVGAIDQLPEKARIVFFMSRFEELSYREIAERLNLTVKTVENHVGRALKELRKKLFWDS